MSARFLLVAATATLLSGCDALAPLQLASCCCQACPTSAAPPAPPAVAPTAEAVPVEPAVDRRARTTARTRRQVRYAYAGSGESDLGAYGGRRYVGVSASVSESESWSERRSYSESSSGYAYGSGLAVEAEDGRGGGPGRRHRHDRGYRLAGVDERGYLTWPGKVED